MMDAIASASMSMSAAQFSVDYAMAMTKKVMDTQELAAEEMLEMLPATQSLGEYIDTYA
ncbi:MAG: putative motility protein [Oscillibacter sp.]|nr:putative motility protein [Oscillibacter sp.]